MLVVDLTRELVLEITRKEICVETEKPSEGELARDLPDDICFIRVPRDRRFLHPDDLLRDQVGYDHARKRDFREVVIYAVNYLRCHGWHR